MALNSQLLVGERWAYLPSQRKNAREVEVVTIAEEVPLRVEVEFIGGHGERTWVSTSRLVERWVPGRPVTPATTTELRDALTRTSKILTLGLALLHEAGKPDEAWALYKKFDPAASRRDWAVFRALGLAGAGPLLD